MARIGKVAIFEICTLNCKKVWKILIKIEEIKSPENPTIKNSITERLDFSELENVIREFKR